MIKEIRLKNFQAHQDTVLELHPGVNVVAGSSNSGKSSVLRAINWAVYNRPSGDAFVSHWARNDKGNQSADTSVEIIFDNASVERKKSKATKNTYTLNDLVLEAVGLDVPEEVSDAINFTEVNTQRQHDAPFLLSESPGEVARFFNKIVHFDAIDKYLSSIESKKRKAKADASHAEETAKRLRDDLAKLDWLEKASKIIERIEELQASRDEAEGALTSLDTQIVGWERHITRLATYGDTIKKAESLVRAIQSKEDKALETARIYDSISGAIGVYERALKVIESAKEVDYAEKLVKRITKSKQELMALYETRETLDRSIKKAQGCKATIEDIKVELPALIKSLPDTCPVCGKEL